MEETQAWSTKAQTLMERVPAAEIDDAEALLEEGLDLPCQCPRVELLEAACERAKQWVEVTIKADEQNAKLERLRSLLEEGESMTVCPATDLAALRERIRVREWADPAKLVAAGKPDPISLDEIRAVVAAGAAIIEGVKTPEKAPEPRHRRRRAVRRERRAAAAGRRLPRRMPSRMPPRRQLCRPPSTRTTSPTRSARCWTACGRTWPTARRGRNAPRRCTPTPRLATSSPSRMSRSW